MLSAWPVIVVMMFRRMPVERALIWSILGGYLLLPPLIAIDIPVLPSLDKHAIPALSACVCLIALGHRLKPLPATLFGKLLVLTFILSPIGTVLTNREPIIFATGGLLPGLSSWDIVSSAAYQFLALLPLFLARDVLSTPNAQRELVRALVVAGLIYSVPMLYEMRMSPQLNTKIYGFFQHSFDQTMRFGGFRPIVFLQHGLWVALFAVTALAAACASLRYAEPHQRTRYVAASFYLGVILIFCRSVGPVVLAAALVPLVLFASMRTQLRVAAVLAIIVVAYPLLRSADLVPVDAMLAQAEHVDADRQGSLRYRFDNEAILLDRANEKPYFGWGAWNRNLVHDYETGQSISVSDGRWIIVIGIGGLFAYIAEFGLLALPLLMLRRRALSIQRDADAPFLGVLGLMLAFNMVDLIPNATLTPITWILAGSILGYAEKLAASERLSRAPRPGSFVNRPARLARTTITAKLEHP
ncbi:MAG: hypothetical protein ABW191_02270 [Aliihoeflea sp.]